MGNMNYIGQKLDPNILKIIFGVFLIGFTSLTILCGGYFNVINGGLIVESDYPISSAAFTIFIEDLWRYPLGLNPNFGNTNIFFSDTVPWFSLIAKVVNTLIGVSINFSWVVVLNFMLFPLFSYRLASKFTTCERTRWLATILLSFNLIMPTRIIGAQHIALSSYWVVLWAMTAVPFHNEKNKLSLEYILVAVIGILTHAYLGAMTLAIIVFQLLVQRRIISIVLAIFIPIGALYILGAFSEHYSLSGGAKAYSLNLAAFTYSGNWAMTGNWFAIKNSDQADILMYPGTGVVLLFFLAVLFFIKNYFKPEKAASYLHNNFQRKHFISIAIISFFLTIYAMAFDIKIADHLLLRIPIPDLFSPLYERFRVTGRFAAPLVYVFILSTVLVCGANSGFKSRYLPVFLIAALLQVGDAFHASRYSTHLIPAFLSSANEQRKTIEELLMGINWSGKVWKNVQVSDLNSQRFIDQILVNEGAMWFSSVYSARLIYEDEAKKMTSTKPGKGDIIITDETNGELKCKRSRQVKHFRICLL